MNNREQGYPKVAGFMDCDRSLLIFRKFGWLHLRSLLSLQDEVVELESKLRRLDQWEFANGDFKNLLSRRRDAQQTDSVRQELFLKIKTKLAEYGRTSELIFPSNLGFPDTAVDELLLRVKKIESMRRPSPRAQSTLFNLIHNTESLVADETEFIHYSPDLAALIPGDEHGWFNSFLEDTLNLISRRLTKVPRSFLTVQSLPTFATIK